MRPPTFSPPAQECLFCSSSFCIRWRWAASFASLSTFSFRHRRDFYVTSLQTLLPCLTLNSGWQQIASEMCKLFILSVTPLHYSRTLRLDHMADSFTSTFCVRTLTAAVNLEQKVLKMLKQSSRQNVSWSSQKKSISSLPSFLSSCRLPRSEHRHEVAD